MPSSTFHRLPIFWKTLVIVGFITVFIIAILVIALSIFMYSKQAITEQQSIKEYEDFIEEFKRNNKVEQKDESIYPVLPKIKDLKGHVLLDLLQIELL